MCYNRTIGEMNSINIERDFMANVNIYHRNWCEKYNKLRGSVVAQYKLLNEKISYCDKRIAECYHYLELEKCNAATRAKVCKILVKYLQERRIYKNEHDDLKIVVDLMKQTAKAEVMQSYEYSQDFLNELMGAE